MKEQIMNTTSKNTPHVAVLAFPFGTHAAPLLSIVRRLAVAAPHVHFSFFNTKKSNDSVFSSFSAADEKKQQNATNITRYDIGDGVPEGYVRVGKPQEDIEFFLSRAHENFKNAMEVAEKEKGMRISCLISDAFYWFGGDMGKEMVVPWVAFWTAGPVSLSAHIYTDIIRETVRSNGGFVGRENQTLNFLPGMLKLKLKDLPEGILFGNIESPFSKMLHQMGIQLPQVSAILINSFEQLDSTLTNDLRSKFPKFLNLGPFHLQDPQPKSSPVVQDPYDCLNWLDKQTIASVAYISFGTVTTPPPHEILALAQGLEQSKVPFIWSLKDNLKAHLPNGFIEKVSTQGLIVPWAPQLEVLRNEAIGVFVTHCGWNSLIESISCGVPMICRPFFGDQRLNGRTIQDVWEIGLEVEGGVFTKDGVVDCLDSSLFRDKGKKMREKINELKKLAHNAIEKNGSSGDNFLQLLDLVSS